MKTLTMILPVLCALTAACQSESATGGASTAPLAKWSGGYSDVSTAATRVVRTAGEWTAMWEQVRREKPRELDAAREMAVAVFLGSRNTGGYAVEIESVVTRDGKLVVEYREHRPAPDMMVTQAITQPWVIAVVPRRDTPVVFSKLGTVSEPQRREK